MVYFIIFLSLLFGFSAGFFACHYLVKLAIRERIEMIMEKEDKIK